MTIYLNETDAGLRTRGTLHEHVAVMIDPTFGRENVVNAHRTFVPGDRLVVFGKDQRIQGIGKDFYEPNERRQEEKCLDSYPSICPRTSPLLAVLNERKLFLRFNFSSLFFLFLSFLSC